MIKRVFLFISVLWAALVFCDQSFALVLGGRTDKVSADIITSTDEICPQQPLEVLVRLKMHDGWHTYWKNPGDVGLRTKIDWKTSEGFKIEEMDHSRPIRFMSDDLVQYGYDDMAYFKIRLTPDPEKIKAGEKQYFTAIISWLACRDECMPETIRLSFVVPVRENAAEPTQKWQDEITRANQTFPVITRWPAQYEKGEDGKLLLNIALPKAEMLKGISRISFLPYQSGIIRNNEAQIAGADEQGNLSLRIGLESDQFQSLPGILNIEQDNNGVSYEINPQQGKDLNTYPPLAMGGESLAMVVLMAFFGGIILNFMPCIFPILSIKAISLIQGSVNKRNARIEALLYLAGVVLCFLLTATVLIGLRMQGENIGWGFQLQSPIFVAVMIVIFFIVFLMLLDVVNLRNPFANRIGRVSFAKQKINAFFTGFFAVLIASPCTAPFMGIAIGYTLTRPVYVYYPVFLALSLGYALPFTLIGMFPEKLHKLLPKPGRWMSTLKKIFAIPVFLTCVWLGWVLFNQLNAGRSEAASQLNWQVFNEKEVAAAIVGKQPVFIDFTAKWCITCLANEKIALESEVFVRLVKEKGIKLYKADWTNRDDQITKALEVYGRNSIPLYVYYHGDDSGYVVLPQLLTPGIVTEYLQ